MITLKIKPAAALPLPLSSPFVVYNKITNHTPPSQRPAKAPKPQNQAAYTPLLRILVLLLDSIKPNSHLDTIAIAHLVTDFDTLSKRISLNHIPYLAYIISGMWSNMKIPLY